MLGTPLSGGRRLAAVVLAAALPLSALAGPGAVAAPAAPAAKASKAPQVPNVKKLAGDLAKQKLAWEDCDFGSPALNDQYAVANVQCATVTVPRDWHDPDNGLTWDVRISQAKNREVTDARYEGTILLNPGGPGGSGLPWGAVMQQRAADLKPYYNFVGFDPRGVGQSSQVDCTYTYDALDPDPDAAIRAEAEQCADDPDVRTITTEQTAYDMDFIRLLLKAPKLSYIGYSYGTWLGTWYENLFGSKYGDRFLLDSSIDGTAPTLQGTWDLQPIARDRQFRTHLMGWIARHDDELGLGTDPRAIHRRYFDATANLDQFTILILWVLTGASGAFGDNSGYPVAASVVQTLIEFGEESSVEPDADPAAVADRVLARAEASSPVLAGRAAAARRDLAPLLAVPTAEERAAVETTGQVDVFDMIRCNDGQWTQGTRYWEAHNADQAAAAPLSASWGLLTTPVCALWSSDLLMPVADDSFPSTVVLQGEMDSQTGWEGGYRAGTRLPGTSLIAIDNEGSHGHFPYGTEAVDRPIYRFFLEGKQPRNITVTQGLPLPGEDTTYETWAPLDARAKHVVVEGSDPWQPADGSARRVGTSRAGDGLLLDSGDAASQEALRQQVLDLYGQRGVRVLTRAGVL